MIRHLVGGVAALCALSFLPACSAAQTISPGTPLTSANLNAALNQKLNLSGGTLTGPLVLPADPTSALQAATKHYVDANAGGSGATSAAGDCSGSTASGVLTLNCTKAAGSLFARSATTDATNAANLSSGILAAARLPAFTGDATSSAGTSSLTLNTVNANVGTFGSSTQVPVVTVNGKGLVTGVTTATITGGGGGASSITGDCTGALSGSAIAVNCASYNGGTTFGSAAHAATSAFDAAGAAATAQAASLQKSNNLSDLANVATARSNLGLATVASTGSAANLSGTLAGAQLPALSGDVTSSAGSSTLTLNTVNANVGSYGSSTQVPVVTVNGKGLVTSVSTATIAAGSSGLTVGSTSIASGSSGSVEYNNGGVLGEKAVTGTGSVVLASSPTISSPTISGAFYAGSASVGAVNSIFHLGTNQNIAMFASNDGTISGVPGIVSVNDANSAFNGLGFYNSYVSFLGGPVCIGYTGCSASSSSVSINGNTIITNDNFSNKYLATANVQGPFTVEETGGNAVLGFAITNSVSYDDAQGGTFIAYGNGNTSTSSVTVGAEAEAIGLSGYGGYVLNQFDTTNATGSAPALINSYTGDIAHSMHSLELSTGAIQPSTFATYGLTAGTVGNVSNFLEFDGCTGSGSFSCENGGNTAQAYAGLTINSVALVTSCGSPGSTHCGSGGGGVAIDMAANQELRWMTSSTAMGLEVWGYSGGLAINNNTAVCTHTPGTSSEAVSCTSDRTVKHDIRDATPVLDYLDSFRIRTYVENASGRRVRAGVIAQEVQGAHRDMVQTQADGKLTVTQPTPWELVKAIQELHAHQREEDRRIRRLTREISHLKAAAAKAAHP